MQPGWHDPPVNEQIDRDKQIIRTFRGLEQPFPKRSRICRAFLVPEHRTVRNDERYVRHPRQLPGKPLVARPFVQRHINHFSHIATPSR
ncbi:hypothetical protein D3C74_278220 [compost metagenome]